VSEAESQCAFVFACERACTSFQSTTCHHVVGSREHDIAAVPRAPHAPPHMKGGAHPPTHPPIQPKQTNQLTLSLTHHCLKKRSRVRLE
jgi:hypothetical protein